MPWRGPDPIACGKWSSWFFRMLPRHSECKLHWDSEQFSQTKASASDVFVASNRAESPFSHRTKKSAWDMS